MRKIGTIIIVLFLAVGMSSIFFCGDINRAYVDSDGAGYFSYLPAIVINHDLSLKTLWDSDFRQYLNGGGSAIVEKDGKYLNSYTMGVAILEFPFFIIAHTVTLLCRGIFEPNGYSLIYQIAIIIAQFFYVAIGMLCINSLISKQYGYAISNITLIAVCLATNLIYYMAYGKSMSHAFSFCLISIFFLLCDRVWYKKSFKGHVLIGAVLGLITMCRVPNILVVFLYIFGELTISQIKKNWKALICKRMKYYLTAFLSFLIVFLPQMAYWYYSFGKLIVNPYLEGSSFTWLMPHIYEVFFSFGRGLFIWHPIYIFCFIGLVVICFDKKLEKKRLGIVLSIIGSSWVISAWDCWWYGSSFGQRSFVDILPILSLCLASFFSLMRNNRVFAYCSVFIVLTLSVHNLNFYYAYNLGNFPQIEVKDYNATFFIKNYYKENIGKIHNNKLLLLNVGETKKVDKNAIQNHCIVTDKHGNKVSDGYMNMLYGPYSKIKKGKYKLKIELDTLREIADSRVVAEVSSGSVAGTETEIFFKEDIMSDCLECEIVFDVEKDMDMAEIWITSYDFGVIFKSYEITRLE